MFSDLLGSAVCYVHYADFVPPEFGKALHINRAYHGLVLNNPDVVRDYIFEDGKVLHTEGNTLFYLPKGSSYRVQRISGEGGCYAINFDFTPQLTSAPFMRVLKNAEGVRRSFREAARVFGIGITGLTVAQRSICEILLAGYEEEKRSYVPDSRALKLAPAMEAIHARFFENGLRISELSALCGMSEVYFRRLFLARYGKSPKDYVTALRIERACRLLSDGGFSTGEIALLCGYAEQAHFSREFKRHVGVSPTDYKGKDLP